MTSSSDNLAGMVDVADEQVENLESSIGQVQEQMDSYSEDIDGVQNGLCSDISDDSTGMLTLYLDSTKVFELSYLDASVVEYGINYGTLDYTTGGVTDFNILDTTGNIVYQYLGINWDNDPEIVKWVDNFAFGNDYLTRPLTSGATYGLYANLAALTSALAMLNANKDKIEASKTVFGGV